MTEPWLTRTALLLGEESIGRLARARIAVLGLGGVGGAAAEGLCRAGVGHLLLIDHDNTEETNLNRQLMVTRETLGLPKTQACLRRLLSICPASDYTAAARFYLPEDCEFLYDWKPDFVIDAIDTVTAKLHLAEQCALRKIPLVTCLGTGARLDPSLLRIGDISETAKNGCGCGLARVMRRELRRRGIKTHTVLYSLEPPRGSVVENSGHGRHPPGSSAFVPPAAGFLLASHAVRYFLFTTKENSPL